jgi:hypothetical protein
MFLRSNNNILYRQLFILSIKKLSLSLQESKEPPGFLKESKKF